MAFDIYGEHLERGHCEVHPYVHEEYPCSLCIEEQQLQQRQIEEYSEHYREEAELYYAEQAKAMAEEQKGMDGDGI